MTRTSFALVSYNNQHRDHLLWLSFARETGKKDIEAEFRQAIKQQTNRLDLRRQFSLPVSGQQLSEDTCMQKPSILHGFFPDKSRILLGNRKFIRGVGESSLFIVLASVELVVSIPFTRRHRPYSANSSLCQSIFHAGRLSNQRQPDGRGRRESRTLRTYPTYVQRKLVQILRNDDDDKILFVPSSIFLVYVRSSFRRASRSLDLIKRVCSLPLDTC